MLLYVDKKKLKRQKIKKTSIRIGIILFLLLNFIHFLTALHTSGKSLYAYPVQKYTQDWYYTAAPVTIFTAGNSSTAKIILIPPILNRENLTTFIYALTLFAPHTNNIKLTSELEEKNVIAQTLQTIIPQHLSASESPAPLIITSDFDTVSKKIIKEKLFPKTLNYGKAKTIADSPDVLSLLNQFFPLPEPPQTKQEKEQAALKNFADNYQATLKKYITATRNLLAFHPAFADMDALLQNAPVCIETDNSQACTVNTKASLLQNIKNTLSRLPANSIPQKLVLLTSIEPVSPEIPLKNDEGLLFKFAQRQKLLLPHEIAMKSVLPGTTDTKKLFAILKQKAGINPDYSNNQMEFYKFKTVEIKL